MDVVPSKNEIPIFLAKLWNFVDDPTTDALIRWSSNGTSFVVQDPTNFAKLLLPQYFKTTNLNSFIRLLNMYGFRKVVNLDSGSLRCSRDDLEFQHPCFVRGNKQLLICIKRKAASSTASRVPSSRALLDGPNSSSLPALHSKESEKEITKVINDVRAMRSKQDTMDVRLNDMKRENESMWAELQELRSKHAHQQIVVNKLIEFFITLLHNTGNTAGTQIRAPPAQLAIQTVPDGPAPVKRPRHENGNPSSMESYRGPIIKDVTDAWSAAYPQQAPEVVDWDRLLSQNDRSSTPSQVLAGLRSRGGAGSAANSPAPSSPAPAPAQSTELSSSVPHSPSTLPPDVVDYLLSLLARQNVVSPNRPNLGSSLSQPGAGPAFPADVSNGQQMHAVNNLASGSQIISVIPLGSVQPVSSLVRHQTNDGIRFAAPIANPIIHGSSSSSNLYSQPVTNGENGTQQNGGLTGPPLDHQVDTIESNIDYIRDLLQNPNYNLDLSQLYQLFPEVVQSQTTQSAAAAPHQTNGNISNNNWPNNSEKALVEYHQQQERLDHEDSAILSTEDHEDFMSVFNSLAADDDLIEGVTIQIPEYPTTSTETTVIPLPVTTLATIPGLHAVTAPAAPAAPLHVSGTKRKRKASLKASVR